MAKQPEYRGESGAWGCASTTCSTFEVVSLLASRGPQMESFVCSVTRRPDPRPRTPVRTRLGSGRKKNESEKVNAVEWHEIKVLRKQSVVSRRSGGVTLRVYAKMAFYLSGKESKSNFLLFPLPPLCKLRCFNHRTSFGHDSEPFDRTGGSNVALCQSRHGVSVRFSRGAFPPYPRGQGER